MKKYYLAVTYDVCEHEDFCIDMNQYRIDDSKNFDEQIRQWAKTDVAPLVKVYESYTNDFADFSLYKEYTFSEYECNCHKSQ